MQNRRNALALNSESVSRPDLGYINLNHRAGSSLSESIAVHFSMCMQMHNENAIKARIVSAYWDVPRMI